MTNAECLDLILLNDTPMTRSEARAILAGPGEGGDDGEDDSDSGDFPPDMGDPGAEWEEGPWHG